MLLEPILLTHLAPYFLMTVGLGAGLCLFFTLKKEIALLRAECSHNTSGRNAEPRASEEERADPRCGLDRLVPRPGAAAPVGLVAGKLPKDRILRLYEQGESPAAIAQSLELPEGQVKLLLKVKRLVGETA
jgi:hypothetical protein